MANRKNTFLIKRSNVAGKIPAAGDLQLGELALNTADNILYASGTTANSILPIGWDRVARTGDTMTGTLFAPSISATTMSAESITLKNYIDFNTGTTTPTNVSGRVFYDNQTYSLAYFPDINQNVKVEVGQQLYIRGYNNTGSIIPKGTVLSIQSATNGLPNFTPTVILHYTNSQVVGLAASDIPINGNGLALSQGILSGITINSFNIGDILYASPFSAGTYVADTNTFPFSARTNQIGYVIATGTSTGEIYVNINNEDENLTLTDIERNILEGNVISTGTYEFTGMTVASTTTFNIAPMRGWLVKNTNEYTIFPDAINIFYTGGTNISVTNIASADSTYVLITSALTVTQQVTFPTPQQRRENIYLGKINHPNRTSILNINNTADYDVSPMSALRDLWSPIKYINQGIIPSPNGANLSFNTSAGTLWGNGINWHNNQLNPNSVSISGKTPASFFYRTQTGGTSSSVTVIDPRKYDIGGVITSISPAGSNDATNQRIYLYPTGVINVLYGQTRYATLSEAVAAIQSETFIPYPNAETTGILIGVISVRNDIVADGQPLTNPDYAKFTLVSKFGESFGGTGGLSTTTLQQAYNNSTTPEIVINSTLGGLSIQNGAGNADNTTHLLEGLNTAGNTTSFIRADGYISGTTFDTNGFRANNYGVTATTVSATTYINLPIDVRVTGGTYAAGTATFINNTGGTFTVTGFSTGGASTFTGGTVTGPTTFTNGLTANTISATTIQTPSLTANSIGLTVTGSINNTISGQTLSTSYNSPVNRLDINSNVNLGFQAGASGGIFFYVDGSATNRSLWLHPSSAVLIGNPTATSPNATLQVTNVGTPNSFLVEDDTNPDSTPFVIDNAGNVGIGTTTPIVKLDVSGDARISGGLTANTFSATTYLNLPIDVRVTGGTYSTGTATFTNNTGGTFSVTGFSTGTTTGNGTANYLAKWTGSTGQANSQIRDDGTNIAIGMAPDTDNKFSIITYSNNYYGLWVRNASNLSGAKGIYGLSNGNVGTQTGVWGVGEGHPTTGTSIGVDGGATDGLLGIGVRGIVGVSEFGSMVTGIGGYFDGRGDGSYGYPTISYSVQLLDGTEGIDKVLVSKTSDGKANWSNELTGLTTVAAATVSATSFVGDGSQLTNVPSAPLPYGLINAISSGNYLI